MSSLEQVDPDIWSMFRGLNLSPSFFIPSNVIMVSKRLDDENIEFMNLAAQFYSLEAWALIPSFKAKVLEYFSADRPLQDYLMYCKFLLQQNDVDSAIDLLEGTIKYRWPDTLRYLHKLNCSYLCLKSYLSSKT